MGWCPRWHTEGVAGGCRVGPGHCNCSRWTRGAWHWCCWSSGWLAPRLVSEHAGGCWSPARWRGVASQQSCSGSGLAVGIVCHTGGKSLGRGPWAELLWQSCPVCISTRPQCLVQMVVCYMISRIQAGAALCTPCQCSGLPAVSGCIAVMCYNVGRGLTNLWAPAPSGNVEQAMRCHARGPKVRAASPWNAWCLQSV